VAQKLVQQWSPEQIAGWLRRQYPGDPSMQISHEAVYRSLFIQSRGVLEKELTAHLGTRRAALSGKPFYIASGYEAVEMAEAIVDDVTVPLIRMRKRMPG
jgi:IS30 family transposase